MREDVCLVNWQEVEVAAKLGFKWWVDSTWEQKWAKRAWSYLGRGRLTSYRNELERTQVMIRFIALVDLYMDFLHSAWQENDGADYCDLAETLGVSPCYVAVLLSRTNGCDNNRLDCSDSDTLWEALEILSAEYRQEVVAALMKGFGDEALLFASLWRTRPEYRCESVDEVVNCPTTDKMVAYEWIDQGCPRCNRGAGEIDLGY